MKQLVITGIVHLIIVLILVGIVAGIASTYQFEFEEVRPELETVLNTKTFELVNETNNGLIFGNPSEVVYNIRTFPDSLVVSCKCTDSVFQPRICRKYQ